MIKKSKVELDNKLNELRKVFKEPTINSNIADLRDWFKDNFNTDIIKVGSKLTYDFTTLFNITSEYRSKFNGDPIQPITVTYLRCDIIFFIYDKHPEFGENYTMWDADWMRWLYPVEIKQSILWKNKEYLRKKDPNEYYLQINLINIDSKLCNYIRDIDFSDYN